MKRNKNLVCDPAICDHCTYLGEGDFICAAEYATTFSITDLVLSYSGGTCRTKLTAAWNQKWYLSGEGSITYVI